MAKQPFDDYRQELEAQHFAWQHKGSLQAGFTNSNLAMAILLLVRARHRLPAVLTLWLSVSLVSS